MRRPHQFALGVWLCTICRKRYPCPTIRLLDAQAAELRALREERDALRAVLESLRQTLESLDFMARARDEDRARASHFRDRWADVWTGTTQAMWHIDNALKGDYPMNRCADCIHDSHCHRLYMDGDTSCTMCPCKAYRKRED